MRLENRVALVTGAATGLGRAYAVRLAAEGAHVCAADVNFAGVQKTARLVAAEGRKALAVEMDVTSEEQTLEGAKKAFDHFGSIDVSCCARAVVPYPGEQRRHRAQHAAGSH